MNIEVHLPNGTNKVFTDPSTFSNPGDRVEGIVRHKFTVDHHGTLPNHETLTIVRETIDAVHGEDGEWVDVTITDFEVVATYQRSEWTSVRELDHLHQESN